MLLNRAKVSTATVGAGTVTLGAAVAPYQTWAAAGATDGATISYLIEDGTAWELGRGVYSAGAATVTRPGPGVDATFDSSTGALLALSGAATIACAANAADFASGGGGGGGGGGSGRVLLQDVTLSSAVANVPLTDFDSSKYLHYEIEISDLLGESGAELLLQCSSDGGATYDTSAAYKYSYALWGSGGYSAAPSSNGASAIQLGGGISPAAPNISALDLKLFNPASTTGYKEVLWNLALSSSDGNNYKETGAGQYLSTSAVNAIRFAPSAGNLTAGRFRLYGIPLVGGGGGQVLGSVSGSLSSTADEPANFQLMKMVVADEDITISKIAFLANTATLGAEYQPFVYDYASQTLLASGPQVTGVTNGYNEAPLSAPLAVAKGSHLWLGISAVTAGPAGLWLGAGASAYLANGGTSVPLPSCAGLTMNAGAAYGIWAL